MSIEPALKTEFIPNDKSIWQPDTAKTYLCDACRRPIFTQHTGDDLPVVIQCQSTGHRVSWKAKA